MRDDSGTNCSRRAILAAMGAGGLSSVFSGNAVGRARSQGIAREVDLTGGIARQRDYFLTEPSPIKGFADAASFRIWDDHGDLGFPRLSIDAVSPERMNRMQMTLVFASGRVLRNFEPGLPHSTRAADGLPRILGAGPMRFECLDPFHRYRITFRGTAIDTTYKALIEGRTEDRRVDLEYEIECTAVAPPWEQGRTTIRSREWEKDGPDRRIMGGDRFEQLMRAKGRIKIGGFERSFGGGALRSRRQGVRDSANVTGYCWQSAIFPSGRGFGYIAYAPRGGETANYNQGYIFLGKGKIIPARVSTLPWLETFDFDGRDVGLTLESALGRTRIESRLVLGAPVLPTGPGLAQLQSISQFRWGEESAFGLTDRATLQTSILRSAKS